MRKLVLYIAVTLDGYIADASGSVSFLGDLYPDDTFAAFFETVDALIMGGNTYRQIVEGRSPERWPYENRKCYVYSGSKSGISGDVEFTRLPPIVLLERIRREYSSDIWLVGGGQVARDYLTYDLVDRMILHIVPKVLGRGISLFPPGFDTLDFILVDNKTLSNGLVRLTYERPR